ncbi:S-formylglutathione hydrolase [Trichococcus ilyis]|uniref:S-formylglutathione hydrolase n=1 Tax=Trichococcus ilyis TaxID=640938 RepID=A0A143Z1T1_9LACT|nr:S-formylglutathione hydrolase [Trichococcus ilyis]CZR04471.1 s-formylglutathione hydrolase [Trichococcus ilyis]SEJ56321.1 S-formylglutathione hydrolase [Trichococcus ilyis]
MTVHVIETHKAFGGEQRKYRHHSETLDCDMVFSLFLPKQTDNKPTSLIWWLSGLTCTDDNFSQKGAFQKYASQHQLAVVMPDTSPRGTAVADDAGWDLGQGAGFYLNATQEPWAKNYRMYDYLTQELPQLVYSLIPNFSEKESIMGHSMGGHGALVIGLKHPERFRSISAFAPILNPSQVPWGQKAFTAYLGPDEKDWAEWDATSLIAKCDSAQPIHISQGTADAFYEVQLNEDAFLQAAEGKKVSYEKLEGYDHSYFTIASFIEEHLQFHKEFLG